MGYERIGYYYRKQGDSWILMDSEFIKLLKKLPDKKITLKKDSKCDFFLHSQCPFKTCSGKDGQFDGFVCDIKSLKEMYLKNVRNFETG